MNIFTQCKSVEQVEGRNIPCEVCGKLFATQDRMKAHMRSAHQADKNCSCSICGSGTTRSPLDKRNDVFTGFLFVDIQES